MEKNNTLRSCPTCGKPGYVRESIGFWAYFWLFMIVLLVVYTLWVGWHNFNVEMASNASVSWLL